MLLRNGCEKSVAVIEFWENECTDKGFCVVKREEVSDVTDFSELFVC